MKLRLACYDLCPEGYVQGSAKRCTLGCVNSHPAARGNQEAGFTQPRAHLIADPCRLTEI